MKYLLILKKWVLRVGLVSLFLWIMIANWSFLFKKKVIGEVVAVEKIAAPIALLTSNNTNINPQVFSFSIAIKDRFSGEIFMASSEDRQWAAVSKDNCVVAAYFPYPPWKFSKGNTSHNARLLRNFTNCEQLPKSQDGSWLDSVKFFFLLD